jgi:hypothetical protein
MKKYVDFQEKCLSLLKDYKEILTVCSTRADRVRSDISGILEHWNVRKTPATLSASSQKCPSLLANFDKK